MVHQLVSSITLIYFFLITLTIFIAAVTLGESKTKVVEKGKPLNLQCNATSTKLQSNAAFIMPPEVEWFKVSFRSHSDITP